MKRFLRLVSLTLLIMSTSGNTFAEEKVNVARQGTIRGRIAYPANGEGTSLEINIGPHEAAQLLGAQSGIEGQFHISPPFVRGSVSEDGTYFL